MKTFRTYHDYLEHDEGVFELVTSPLADTVEVSIVGDTAIVGYLTLDNYPQNPLDYDGMGSIYSSHRDYSDQHRPMQDALGLDADWNPALGDLYDTEEFKAHVKECLERMQRAASHATVRVELDYEKGYDDGYLNCFYAKTRRDYFFELDFCRDSVNITYRKRTHEITRKDLILLWRECRNNGTIGIAMS